jgi:hypothetical protein
MISETVENMLKIHSLTRNIQPRRNNGNQMMYLRRLELKRQLLELLINRELLSTQESQLSGHGEVTYGYVDGFIDLVDVLEFVLKVK